MNKNSKPSNRVDLARFESLSEWDQDVARKTAAKMYDGNRTYAASWKLVLDVMDDMKVGV